ncbi:MAG: 3-phosphoglycerate dehydrogenase [Saprospiraceae bacterium]|nr:3-phosphoglycerate dehydrogenase [Saprospiraceae bacterium]MBK9631988.1 3-phosphoglycerate dehydrogenase [Saprospiraceae bacterium]
MSWKILINDGMEASGVEALKDIGFEVNTKKIEQVELIHHINEYDGIIIRSATKVKRDLIDAGQRLKFIARGGVGLDNVDVAYAKEKGIEVINTPGSSSLSVAELAFAHILSLSRGLQEQQSRLNSAEDFSALKKKYSQSSEVGGKKLLLIGFGRIAKELAKMCLGFNMKIQVNDPYLDRAELEFEMCGQSITTNFEMVDLRVGLPHSDFVSIHTPFMGKAILGEEEFGLMKKSAFVINTSRGENIDETALLVALNLDKIAGAGLDVFQNEPNVNPVLLSHPKISKSPHIGASTLEAQERIAGELVGKIERLYKDLGN